MENILEITNLCKKYDNFELKNISFTLPKGMIMGFIGENGAGKTTTIKAILDIIKTYSGEIKIFGLDNRQNDKIIKEDIGVVLDDMFFPEILTPNDINNTMQHLYQNWDTQTFYNYLQKFSLLPNKPLKTFSKGMQKKLEIATAISHHPKLLILDEPTSGLDPIARSEIIEIFQNLIAQDDCSIFLSSHITTDLETIADYITFIHNGKIILSKPTPELLDEYGIAKCSEKQFKNIDPKDYLKYQKTKYEYDILIENKKAFKAKYNIAIIDKITLDELMVLMIKGVK